MSECIHDEKAAESNGLARSLPSILVLTRNTTRHLSLSFLKYSNLSLKSASHRRAASEMLKA